MMNPSFFVQDFRELAPYIQYLRGKTLVLAIEDGLLNRKNLNTLAADFNLLAALGIKLVLIHGYQNCVLESLKQNHLSVSYVDEDLLIDESVLPVVKQVCGQLQFDIQAALSLGYAHAPQRPPRLRVASGNYLIARPVGVIAGVDRLYSGLVRKVDKEAIDQSLNMQAVVLMSPLAVSPVGQTYALSLYETAQAVAVALEAEKLVFLTTQSAILDSKQNVLTNLSVGEALYLLEFNQISSCQKPIVLNAIEALKRNVKRVQVLSGSEDGALIRELFTREGAGTSIARDSFMRIRVAEERDIADIIALTQPLAEKGVLLQRSHQYFEQHIREFFVLEHDCQIYGCVALKTFVDTDAAELACLVVSNEARSSSYGDDLLNYVIQQAKSLGKERLFALTTHTADWFLERGFQAASVEKLPLKRQQEYLASTRQSKIFCLQLAA